MAGGGASVDRREARGGAREPHTESAAIEMLHGILGAPVRRDVLRGIDDDCAVIALPGGVDLLLTVDAVVRDVHFCDAWQTPRGIGWRALAAAVSDIAAMAGEPMAVVVAVGAAGGWDPALPDIYRGMKALAERLGIDVVGGDITRLPRGLSLSLTVAGLVEHGRAVLRSGARPGDEIWVTGCLGQGWAIREEARAGRGIDPAGLEAYEGIVPRVREALFLAREIPLTSLIDLSDGLSTDLSHVCRLSGVGACLDAGRLPVSRRAADAAAERSLDPVEPALHGGEDFELCFTARRGGVRAMAGEFRRRFGVSIARIGRIAEPGTGIRLRREDGGESVIRPGGYDHIGSEAGER